VFYAQGSKIFVFRPEKDLYILFKNWITKFDRENFKFIPIAKFLNISNVEDILMVKFIV